MHTRLDQIAKYSIGKALSFSHISDFSCDCRDISVVAVR